MDGDNPLRSDDSYLAGFFAGMVAAIFALLYSTIEKIPKIASLKELFYGLFLFIWCLFFSTISPNNSEIAGITTFIAICSLVVGIAVWILCKLRLPRWLMLLVSSTGVLLLIMYAIVCFRMAQRH